MESKEKINLALNYRKLKETFATIDTIKEINQKLNEKKGEISDKELSVSVDVSQKSNWETTLTSYLDDVPFDYIGKGEQNSVKMKLALEAQSHGSQVIMVEEPENHLSFSNMNKLISSIKEKNEGKQVIMTTHSSFVLNKLGIDNMILLNGNKEKMLFNELSNDTRSYFMRLPGYDTLRVLLSETVILVEGPSDELIVQRAYRDKHGMLPIENGVDVYCTDDLSFKRFLDIAVSLNKKIHVITDNDGDVENKIEKKYEDYLQRENIHIHYDPDEDYNTLEPQIIKANSDDLSVLKSILNHEDYSTERLTEYMTNNKTKCALLIFESDKTIKMPGYIYDAI